MERTLVEQLLAKYFEGTTTLSEENQLKDYFSSQTIAPHLMQYQALFGYFKAEKSVQMEEKIPLQKRKFQRSHWVGIAAVLVLFFGLATFFFYPSDATASDLGTYDNPEEALIATHKALLMVSEQVNIGMKSAVYLEEYENTTKTIFK